MSSTEDSLKKKNFPKVIAFVGINLIIYWSLLNGKWLFQDFDSFENVISKLTNSGIIASLASIFTTVVNGQISTELKRILVFKKIKNPLPGCRAFSKYARQDPRVDVSALYKKYPNIPAVEGPGQNQIWYRIYKQHAENQSVIDSHKDFLLTRELTALSMLFLISFGTSAFFLFVNTKLAILYSFLLLSTFFLISNAARNYGIRLVQNVLAVESAK